jgi:diphthamide synthase (EF-2-diphthine--ammonia ligase)
MSQIKKAVFNWSGGKDSAMALREILKNNSFEVVS